MLIMYFTADWCGPCKTFGPRLQQFAFENYIDIDKVNVDYNMDLARSFDVMSLPTTIWFKGSKPSFMKVGPLTDEQLRKSLKELVG